MFAFRRDPKLLKQKRDSKLEYWNRMRRQEQQNSPSGSVSKPARSTQTPLPDPRTS